MDPWKFLLEIVILLGSALAMGVLFGRLRQNPIVGYLLAGILLGPGGFHVIHDNGGMEALASLGVALLMFSIGLEFSWARLKALGAVAAVGGTLQVGLTLALFAFLGHRYGLGWPEAIVVGAAVAMTSTTVTMRILTDRAELDTNHGRNALGISLLQDVAVVPLVLLVSTLAGSGSGWQRIADLGERLAIGGGLVLAMVLVSRHAVPRLLRLVSSFRERDLPILLALTVFLLVTWSARALDLSPALGAFVAGMLLAETPFADQIRADVSPLRAAFVTIFFGSIGMLAQRPPLNEMGPVLGLALAILIGKTVIIVLIILLFRRPLRVAVKTGMALAQAGEFSFVLADMALKEELLSPEVFRLVLASAVLTLLAAPYLVTAAPRVAALLERWRWTRHPGDLPEPSEQRRVILIGLGPAGRAVVEKLQAAEILFIALELNPATVESWRTSIPIRLGDATQPEILERAGIRHASALIVTIPDPAAARLIIRQAKAIAPEVTVIARLRQHIHAGAFRDAGADVIIDEESWVGQQLGVNLIASLNSARDAGPAA